ncbi:MAG: hypothetical protein JW888_02595 [Pirellulales bacterium]|nr:hypothetical protein [Pirellulales bacterium]
MTDIFTVDQPEKLWEELQRLVADRAAKESAIAADYATAKQQADEAIRAARRIAFETHNRQQGQLETRYLAARKAVVERCDLEHATLEKEYQGICNEAKTRHKKTKAAQKQKLQEAQWEANTVFEATKDAPSTRFAQFEAQINTHRRGIAEIRDQAAVLVERRGQKPELPELEPSDWPDEADPAKRFGELVLQAQQQWKDLADQPVPRLFEGGHWLLLAPLFWLLAVVPSIFCFGWPNAWLWSSVSAVIGLTVWGGLMAWLYALARRQTSEAHATLHQTFLDAELSAEKAVAAAKMVCENEEAAISERLHAELDRASEQYNTVVAESRACRDTEVKKADEDYPPRLTELIVQRERDLEQLEAEHTREMEEFEQRYREETQQREDEYSEKVEQRDRLHLDAWNEMAHDWQTGMDAFDESVDELNRALQERFFDWTTRSASEWLPVAEMPPAVPFGRISIDLARLDGGIPADERLRRQRNQFILPAMVAFPNRSLLLKTRDEGRAEAVETIQTMMLRMLLGSPPGKVRFTVVDPVGLGESFSAFMHLTDFDEQVVASRIWTESAHIEQQLVKLTEHMENVLQVYLRNEFETIQQYNDFAGEMAEPYRVLVVSNFPANFSESAAQRLLSIIASGARCGVHVLLSVDTRMKLPHGFDMADLESQMLELAWRENRFVWKDSPLAALPLERDTPPEAKPFTELVRAVGERIREGDRVEVPFEFVVPEQSNWWKGDSARELDVPLGRAGAMKLQHLHLGRGTSQHVLLAGKTGSGKSNLLHAIITNIALWYAPDQVELYLVDFKKGVEFKTYAEYALPHARVVAVESEREFGLSVLQRLDAELKQRGDRFRQQGVQDVAAWRKARPDETMPRVLLVIDEFQELFVEDDRIGQESALLLDRLVRQGRAFGMHVLLGSQTLAGAYSLPRATIGQMAVRIALQCSESDAHLILSEENTAARLLTRPGEAIYNDANGLFEGNHPFQVVWLPDHEKADYLKRLRRWADSREFHAPPAIVFEGNAAADPTTNHLLRQALATDHGLKPGEPVRAWLGAAVAIKDPTAAVFRRQGGSNLLLVGHDDESALGILATSLVSLAAQAPAVETGNDAAPTFFILDGTRPEAPEAGFWKRFAESLPQQVRVADSHETAAVIGDVTTELTRRQSEGIDDGPPVYFVVFNLGRFRDLRREEDTFRFSSSDDDQPPKPASQFTRILREGPAMGIHVLVWSDTCNTLTRWLERQTIHDLEMRVAFQMSSGDSSTLIDSAEAGKLGAHRAILYDEGLGQTEKFRPYGPPSQEWLADVRTQLAATDPQPPGDSAKP